MNATAPADDVHTLALLEWHALSDALLRGLVHSFNNRLTALSACAELARMGDEDFAVGRTLPTELERLLRLSGHFRLLASEGDAPEALELGAALDEAMALHAHHPRKRTVHCALMREVPHVAVRAPKRALARLLLLLIESGTTSAEQRGHVDMVLRLHALEPWVAVHASRAILTPGIAATAADCGALAEQLDDGIGIRLPSLASLRQQERETRAAREADAG